MDPSKQKTEQGYLSNLAGSLGEDLIAELFKRWGWLPRRISADLDQGLDTAVEVGHAGRGLGFHFHVSVKASNGSKAVAKTGKGFDIKKNNVAYVLSQRWPVFLLFAKLTQRTIYWVDMKAALLTGSVNKSNGVRIIVPASNALHVDVDSDTKRRERGVLLDALEASERSWHIPRFDLVPATIQQHEQALSQLDPRCEVKILAGADQITYEVSAREPMDLQVSMKTTSTTDQQKVAETLKFGTANSISVDSFVLKGSPLMEDLLPLGSKGVVSLATQPAFSLTLALGAARQSGDDKPIFLRFTGPFTRGAHGGEGTTRSSESPLAVRLRIDIVAGKINFAVETEPSKWTGRSVLPMHGLIRARDALRQMATSGSWELRLLPEVPDPIFRLDLPDEMGANLRLTAAYLHALNDLREIALLYCNEALIGTEREWFVEEMNSWQIGRRVLDGDMVDIEMQTLTFRVSPKPPALLDSGSCMFIAPVPLDIMAFGKLLCQIPVDIYAGGFAATYTSVEDNETEVVLKPQLDSVLRVRRASSEPLEDLIRGTRGKKS